MINWLGNWELGKKTETGLKNESALRKMCKKSE